MSETSNILSPETIDFTKSFNENIKLYSVFCNLTGFETTAATILEKSVDHRWYEYLGNPISIKVKDRDLVVKAGDAFGLKPEQDGYSMETDVFHDKPVKVSLRDGYVLSRMARQLSRREQKFRHAKL